MFSRVIRAITTVVDIDIDLHLLHSLYNYMSIFTKEHTLSLYLSLYISLSLSIFPCLCHIHIPLHTGYLSLLCTRQLSLLKQSTRNFPSGYYHVSRRSRPNLNFALSFVFNYAKSCFICTYRSQSSCE